MVNGLLAIKDDMNVFVIYMEGHKDSHSEERMKLKALLGNIDIKPCLNNRAVETRKAIFRSICSKIENKIFKEKGLKEFFEVHLNDFRPYPASVTSFVNDVIERHRIDIVQMEMRTTLPFVLSLPPTVKKIFIHHELFYVCNELLIKDVQDEYAKACSAILKIEEIGLLNKCDLVATLSETDKEKLLDAGVTAPIKSSLAIVNTEIINKPECNGCNRISFVGPEANKPGILWFLENCWSSLLSYDSNYTLDIIGRWSEKERESITNKWGNIFFKGFVPDLYGAVKDSISIVPVIVGSGIRMKILEMSALGVPVVSTSIGIEGLPFQNGINCAIADTPEQFTSAIIALRDKKLREKYVTSSQRIVAEGYSKAALRKNRLSFYE